MKARLSLPYSDSAVTEGSKNTELPQKLPPSRRNLCGMVIAAAIRWDEKAGLRRDAVRSQVIDALEAQEIKETSRLAYVSVSRGQYDAQIYTNDRSELARDLSSVNNSLIAPVCLGGIESARNRA